MNDRFKFRIFSKVAKKFIYFDNSELCVDKENMGLLFRTEHLYLGNYEELQQSTGLKDKNGKLIYEGDIVCDRSELEPVCNLPLLVYWSDRNCEFSFKQSKIALRSKLGAIDSAESHTYEVIGNIYENEDLLKCENQ